MSDPPHNSSIASCRTVSVGTGKSLTPRTASSSEALRTSEIARAAAFEAAFDRLKTIPEHYREGKFRCPDTSSI